MFKNEHDNSESDTRFFLQKRNLSCTLLEKKTTRALLWGPTQWRGYWTPTSRRWGWYVCSSVSSCYISCDSWFFCFFVLCCNYSLSWYPLVNIQTTMKKSALFMGKSIISMAMFSSKLLNYQRVPSGNLTWLLKMAIEIVSFPFSHSKWWFFHSFLYVYQRVSAIKSH